MLLLAFLASCTFSSGSLQVELLSLTDEHGHPFFGEAAVYARRRMGQSEDTDASSSRIKLSFSLKDYKEMEEVLSFDFPRIPSLISDEAIVHIGKEEGPAATEAPYHAPVFGSEQGALTLTSEDGFEGTLWHPTDKVILNVRTENQGRTLHVVNISMENWLCGTSHDYNANNHSEAGNGAPDEQAGYESESRRSMQEVARWTNCYNRDWIDRQLRIGIALGSKLYYRMGGTPSNAQAFLSNIFATINTVYGRQLGIVFKIDSIYIQSTNGGPSWNQGNSCPMSISTQLDYFSSWASSNAPKGEGLWHLIDDCFPGAGIIGLAWIGTLCNSARNTGVSWYSRTMWLTVAHEMGHNFNAQHSFELGQGRTGGIMDYGDGKLNGEYQFDTRFRKNEMCAMINSVVDRSPYFQIASSKLVVECGNGMVEGDEECECRSGSGKSCRCCNNCKLTSGAVCTPDAEEGSCCTSQCQFASTSTTCPIGDRTGFCSAGKCTETACDNWGNFGNYCGLHDNNPCKIKCTYNGQCSDMEGWTHNSNPINQLTGVPCGNGGTCNNGVCQGGGLTSTTTTTTTTPWTVPNPTRINDCDRYVDAAFSARPDVAGGGSSGFSRVACDQACSNQPNCHSFVSSGDGGFCALFSSNKDKDDLSHAPGQETSICPGRGVVVNGCDKWPDRIFKGYPDLGSPSATRAGITLQECWNRNCGGYTLTECDQACKNTPGCHSFTYGNQNQYCELWSAAKKYTDLWQNDGGYATYICSGQGLAGLEASTPTPPLPPRTCKLEVCSAGWHLKADMADRSCPLRCTNSYCCEQVSPCDTLTCFHNGTCGPDGWCRCRNGWSGPTCQLSASYKGQVSVVVRVQLDAGIDTFDLDTGVDSFVQSVTKELEMAEPSLLVPAKAFTDIHVVLRASAPSTVTLEFEVLSVTRPDGTRVDPLEVVRRLRELSSETQSSFLVGMSVYSAVEKLQPDADAQKQRLTVSEEGVSEAAQGRTADSDSDKKWTRLSVIGVMVASFLVLLSCLSFGRKRVQLGPPTELKKVAQVEVAVSSNPEVVEVAVSSNHEVVDQGTSTEYAPDVVNEAAQSTSAVY